MCQIDSLETVDSLAKDKFRFHTYARDVLEIHQILARNWEIHLCHVSREANATADCLSDIGAILQSDATILDTPPERAEPFFSKKCLRPVIILSFLVYFLTHQM